MLSVPQSTPICILLSAVGGAIEVAATAILAYKDAQEHENAKKWSTAASLCALSANVALQVTSSVIGNLFATWFGPVSLVAPMFLCAQLMANMLVFGYLLGLEAFNKDMKVGTYVVLIGVVLLPIVGPDAQGNQDVQVLLGKSYSLLWSALVVFGMFMSALLLGIVNIQQMAERKRIAILLVARATSFTVNLTVSKIMVLDISMLTLVGAIVLKITSGLIITYAVVVQASAVPQVSSVVVVYAIHSLELLYIL